MRAFSPLLAVTLGAEIILTFFSVSASAREASRARSPNPLSVNLAKERPIFAPQPSGALVAKVPPVIRSPYVVKSVMAVPHGVPSCLLQRLSKPGRVPSREVHWTPRSRLKFVVASTILASITICFTGASNLLMIFLASSMVAVISFTTMVFVRSSTLTLPRSLLIDSICVLISLAWAKSSGKYSVIRGSNFLLSSFSSSLFFLLASISASACSRFFFSSDSSFAMCARVVIQITLPWRLIARSLFARTRSRAWSQGTFSSLIETVPFTSGPQITFNLLTSPISLKILVTSALTKFMVMGVPLYLTHLRPGIPTGSLGTALGLASVKSEAFFCGSRSLKGMILFSGGFTAVAPKSI